jgi:hypothetical protein
MDYIKTSQNFCGGIWYCWKEEIGESTNLQMHTLKLLKQSLSVNMTSEEVI